MQRDTKDSSFSGLANYKIVVRGEVPESWKSRLAGMEITVVDVPGAARQDGTERSYSRSGGAQRRAKPAGAARSVFAERVKVGMRAALAVKKPHRKWLGKGLQELILATHAGMTTQEFDEAVREFLNTAQHPKFKQMYNRTTYQPMLDRITRHLMRPNPEDGTWSA